jgi:DNA-binding MarR family transcriptional regulator
MATRPPASVSAAVTPAAVDEASQALLAVLDGVRERAQTVLSVSQLRALQAVERDEGLNLGALADTLGMLLSSASRLSDRLVATGMIERTTGTADRREVSLRLTAYGRKVLTDLRSDRQRRLEQVLAAMAPSARAALLRGLREFSRVATEHDIVDMSA